jgi:hypothetical protein
MGRLLSKNDLRNLEYFIYDGIAYFHRVLPNESNRPVAEFALKQSCGSSSVGFVTDTAAPDPASLTIRQAALWSDSCTS